MIDFHANHTDFKKKSIFERERQRKKIQFIKHELSKQTRCCFYKFPDCTRLNITHFRQDGNANGAFVSIKFMGTISRMCAGIKRKYVTGFKDNKLARKSVVCAFFFLFLRRSALLNYADDVRSNKSLVF